VSTDCLRSLHVAIAVVIVTLLGQAWSVTEPVAKEEAGALRRAEVARLLVAPITALCNPIANVILRNALARDRTLESKSAVDGDTRVAAPEFVRASRAVGRAVTDLIAGGAGTVVVGALPTMHALRCEALKNTTHLIVAVWTIGRPIAYVGAWDTGAVPTKPPSNA
jgi:hypothetical protein